MFEIAFDGIEFVPIDDREQFTEFIERIFRLFLGDGTGTERIGDLVEINDFDTSVWKKDDIREQIREDVGIGFFAVSVGDDVAVPV